MKRLTPLLFILVLFCTFGVVVSASERGFFGRPPQTQAETPSTPHVSLRPASQALIPTDYVTVAVNIADVEHLFGLKLRLLFDPEIVIVADAQEAEPGVQILPGEALVPFYEQHNQADNALGIIDLEGVLLDTIDGPQPVTGTLDLALITFQGVGFGSTKIELETVELARGVQQAITPTVGSPAHITVLSTLFSHQISLPLTLRDAK
jgi:hypothetical protein